MYFWTFLPLGLDLPRSRAPWLTVVTVTLLLAAFAWLRWWPNALSIHPWDLVYYVGTERSWTVASALLLHADWLHLAGNLAYLVAFMPALEERLGRAPLLLLLMATGVGGNLAHGAAATYDWLGQGGLGIIGASGAISGLLGFALVRLPHARVAVAYWVLAPLQGQNRAGRVHLPIPVAVLAWLLLQVVSAAVASESGSGVSYPAHLGGCLLGIALALVLGGAGEGRREAILQDARRYLGKGKAWPAVGAYTEYLQQCPDDDLVRLEAARALLAAEAGPRALVAYRGVYKRAVAAGRWDRALDAFEEGRRLQPGLGLSAELVAQAAQQADRAGRCGLAIKAYTDLVRHATGQPEVDRGWVRLVLLLHGDSDYCREAQTWLDAAMQALPAGAWRDYLAREFRLDPPAATCGASRPAKSAAPPAPGS